MDNDNSENIIDSTETNEEELNLDNEDEQDDGTTEEKKPAKVEETPQAKRARLKRMLEQHDKKYGFKDEEKPQPKEPEAKDNELQLSPKDGLLLAKANVDIEDVDEVVRYAQFQGISIADALKDKTLKTILANRVEERQTAAATQTGGKRGAPKVTGDVLMEKAKQNQLPEKETDIEALAAARMEAKLKK